MPQQITKASHEFAEVMSVINLVWKNELLNMKTKIILTQDQSNQ